MATVNQKLAKAVDNAKAAKSTSTTTPVSAAIIATLMVAQSNNSDAGKLVKVMPKGVAYKPQNKVGANGHNNGQSWAAVNAMLSAGPCTRGTLQAVLTAIAGHHDFITYHFKPANNRFGYDFSKAKAATPAQLSTALKALGITQLGNYKAA